MANKHTHGSRDRKGGGMIYWGAKGELRPLTGGMENPGIQGVLEQEPSSRWCPKQIAGNRRAVSMLNYQASSALMREYPGLQGVGSENQGMCQKKKSRKKFRERKST